MVKGYGANSLKDAPSHNTQFLVYEFMKKKMVWFGFGISTASGSLNAGAQLMTEGIIGMVAAIIVYPLKVVKTVLIIYPEQCDSIPGALSKACKDVVYTILKKNWEAAFGPIGT
eukprot:15349215-Ditylum_brightwellii.AAC.1